MINWTKEMVKELKTMNNKDFCKKYNISSPTVRKKKIELFSKQEKKETLKELNASKLEIIPSVILDIDKLIKDGYNFYIANCNNEIKKMENTIMDLEHSLEGMNLPDSEIIKIGRSIAECRKIRRVYKNEKQFLETNKIDCEHFISFIKNLKEYSNGIEKCIYKPRILKDILGEKIKPNQELPEEIVERLFNLEKYNIKQERINKRAKGQKVDIDLLKSNYQDLFKTLDKETQEGIMQDCENQYKGVPIPKIKEYTIMFSILPQRLVELGYFLR